jgi:uncharacterized membrane protein
MPLVHHLRARPRMLSAALIGIVAGFAIPADRAVTHSLIGWNVGVWLYLVLIAMTMIRADHHRLRKAALAHSEGALTVSAVVVAASLASFAAIVLELVPSRGHVAAWQVGLTLVTVTGSWLLLPTLFTLNYASLYYSVENTQGLRFPCESTDLHPHYADFVYFSFTIAVALQTADVAITTRRMRQVVLVQSVLSFVFNTTILAFLVNIASGLF